MVRRKRLIVQGIAALLSNLYIPGFFSGKIYTGAMKYACVPGLNCYSCPGAIGSCPIGALQSVFAGVQYTVSFYVLGFMALFGTAFGRLICGYLCPFGLVQDLLYKIKTKKAELPLAIHKKLVYLKYAVFLIFVVLLPIFLVDAYGSGEPYFCKLICPSGTLMAGIPLVSLNESLRASIGFLFNWKVFLLLLTIVSAMILYRPFCKYLCPLGAFYALFNKISFYKMYIDKSKCINCKTCEKECKMRVPITQNQNHGECIRCGACKHTCPSNAIKSYTALKNVTASKEEQQRTLS